MKKYYYYYFWKINLKNNMATSGPNGSKNGGGSKKPSPPSQAAEKFFGSEVDIKGGMNWIYAKKQKSAFLWDSSWWKIRHDKILVLWGDFRFLITF